MGSEKKSSNFQKIILPSFAPSFSSENKNKRISKRVVKEIMKWTKIAVYLFLFGMGLYGCGQSMFEYWVGTSTHMGNGLEIGFLPGTTMNSIYDLSAASTGPFYPMSGFTLIYGPFYALFVWPFAQLLLLFMYATRDWPAGLNALLGIFIILLIIKLITLLVSIKSTLQSEKMSEIQGKIAEVNAKYKDVKDMQSKQKKQMEVQELYKKHNVKPFAAFEQIFVTLPIFLIIYRVITIVRPLKATELFGIWDLSESPLTQIFSNFTEGGWTYIFFLIFVVPAQFLSQRIPQHLARKRNRNARTVGTKNKKSLDKSKTVQTVMNVFMGIIAAVSACGIGLYWFLNSLLSLLQSYILHKIILHKRNTSSNLKTKLSKLGIN